MCFSPFLYACGKLPAFRDIAVEIADEHGGGGAGHQVAVLCHGIDIDHHGAVPVVAHDSYGGGALPRVDVFDEIHIEGKTNPDVRCKLKEFQIQNRKISQKKYYDFSRLDKVEETINKIVDDVILFMNNYTPVIDKAIDEVNNK